MTTELRTLRLPVDDALVARFWTKVDRRAPAECWLWQGKTQSGGYGVIWFGGKGGKTIYAHRLAYLIATGIDPVGNAVCHRCDNPTCVNPDHLFLGTIAVNVQDMIAKGRNRIPDRKIGEHVNGAKLSEGSVATIRERAAKGETSANLAAEFGVDPSHIRSIVRREYWQHVGGEARS